jgi:transporter family protein
MMFDSWQSWAVLSAIFAALSTIAAKPVLSAVDSDVAQFVRTLFVVVVLSLLIGVSGKLQHLSHLSQRTWAFLALSGLATCASWVCYFRALFRGDASRVASVDKLSVILVAIFAALVLRERLSLLSWIGVGVTTIGLVLVSVGK